MRCMCNAWNHAPGCPCGWGGGWKGGSGSRQAAAWSGPYLRFASFVNPNATCPVCGAPVFYFQSAAGGRVYFDELGPPWPKHACTDNSHGASSHMPGKEEGAGGYRWQRDGWTPFMVTMVFDYDPALVRIDGNIDGQPIELYLRKSGLPGPHSARDFLIHAAIQSSKASPGTFRLSILGPPLKPIEITGYLSSNEARGSGRTSSDPRPLGTAPRRVVRFRPGS